MNSNLPELSFLDEPNLIFGHNQKTPFAKDGLLWFGPISSAQKPISMRVGVIGSTKGIALYQKWVKKINRPVLPDRSEALHHILFPGFEAAFDCKWPENPVCSLTIPESELLGKIRIKDRHQAIYATVQLFEDQLRRHLTEQDAHVGLWFVIIPEEIYTYGRPNSRVPTSIAQKSPVLMTAKLANSFDISPSLFEEDNEIAEVYRYDLNFHNQLKARLLDTKAVIQVVRETTLSPEDFMENGKETRQLQDAASVAWNLCTTAYFKSSGKPWRLADVREGVCYVGLVFKQDTTSKDPRNACCGAQMFLDSGDGLVFKGAVGPWYVTDSKEFHLSADKAKEISEKIVEAYSREHGFPPKELFIHGKTRMSKEEWDGFVAGVPEGTAISSIRIRQDSHFKLYSSTQNAVLRGMWLQIHPRKGLLWTRGYVPRLQTYQGREVPNPLSIEICFGNADLKQVMQDILGLTKVNFNRCDFSDGEPVTLRFADRVGEILTATPLSLNLPPLPFKHYI